MSKRVVANLVVEESDGDVVVSVDVDDDVLILSYETTKLVFDIKEFISIIVEELLHK